MNKDGALQRMLGLPAETKNVVHWKVQLSKQQHPVDNCALLKVAVAKELVSMNMIVTSSISVNSCQAVQTN